MKYLLPILISVLLSSLITVGIFFGQDFFTKETTSPNSEKTSQVATSESNQIKNLEDKIDQLEASYSALVEQTQDSEDASDTKTDKAKTKTVTKYVTQTTTAPFTNQVIYLGSDNTNHRTWQQSGVEVTLNSNDYPAGTTARFEAGLKIIGGEAWARLVNKTTGAILTQTEVMHNTSTTKWVGSAPFSLHSGNNTYVVEIRSSSGETAILDGSRIFLE